MLFSVCAKYLFPSLPFTRMPRRLACASPRLEQLPTSKYFFCLGDHASTSQDFTFRSARSPEQHSSVRTGISRERNRSTVFFQSYHTILCFLPVCIQRSFPVFQTDGFCIHHVLRFHELLFLYGSMENSCQCLWKFCFINMVSMNLPIIECSLVPIRYRSSPSILYIIASISAKLITPVTTLASDHKGGTQYVNPRSIIKSRA